MLCGAHIGALAQGLCRDAQGEVTGGLWHRLCGGHQGLQGVGGLAGQHRQAVAGLGNAGLQCGYLCRSLFTGGQGLFHFQRSDQACLGAPLRDLQGFLLAGEVALGNLQLGLLAAQLDVGQCHLCGDRNLHIGQRGLCGLCIGLGCAERVALPAKDIGFPAGVQADLEGIDGVIAAGLAALRRARCIDARQPLRVLHIAQRTGLLQCSLCRAHAGVGLQGLGYQGAQQRVVETLPPLREVGGRTHRGGRPGCGNRQFGRRAG